MYKIVKLKQDVKLKVVEVIINNVYVDDICDFVGNVNDVKMLIFDVDEVFEVGGFKVKKWILKVILDFKECLEEVVFGGESYMEEVLGIVWFFKEDKFFFKIKIDLVSEKDFVVFVFIRLIKCQIFSKLEGIFDLIGVGVVVFIKSKIVM